ncbi:hypothetical protein [Streptomyces sp. ME19-01-6]|uniref:hypothetical protein n=1 Tax=Streptomyces sp. ME19-01-6 TaxID=3028686 RepID=UPI0029A0A395|nr:hypothetical protein [Streptomyces sp. ME19-01-6]MDX3232851.1 hypothetical protein [Streptomyces sp. ME19-01-6]
MKPQIVRQTKVKGDRRDPDARNLTVSTVKLGFRYYDTVIFDDREDKRHSGKHLDDWVIDKQNVRDNTREEAMDTHREALYAARTGIIR